MRTLELHDNYSVPHAGLHVRMPGLLAKGLSSAAVDGRPPLGHRGKLPKDGDQDGLLGLITLVLVSIWNHKVCLKRPSGVAKGHPTFYPAGPMYLQLLS